MWVGELCNIHNVSCIYGRNIVFQLYIIARQITWHWKLSSRKIFSRPDFDYKLLKYLLKNIINIHLVANNFLCDDGYKSGNEIYLLRIRVEKHDSSVLLL